MAHNRPILEKAIIEGRQLQEGRSSSLLLEALEVDIYLNITRHMNTQAWED